MYKEVIDDYKQYEEVRKKIKGDDEDESRKGEDALATASLPTKAYK